MTRLPPLRNGVADSLFRDPCTTHADSRNDPLSLGGCLKSRLDRQNRASTRSARTGFAFSVRPRIVYGAGSEPVEGQVYTEQCTFVTASWGEGRSEGKSSPFLPSCSCLSEFRKGLHQERGLYRIGEAYAKVFTVERTLALWRGIRKGLIEGEGLVADGSSSIQPNPARLVELGMNLLRYRGSCH